MSKQDHTQTRIADDGSIEDAPKTWDGEPLWSPSTVAEGLFDSTPFAQMRGQTSIDVDAGEVEISGHESGYWGHSASGEHYGRTSTGELIGPYDTLAELARELEDADNGR